MGIEIALLVAGAYVIGSIPTGFLTARLLRGVDLRLYGSGTPTGSMIYEHVSRWAVVPVGLADVAKVALPTWLAGQLDLGSEVALAAAVRFAIYSQGYRKRAIEGLPHDFRFDHFDALGPIVDALPEAAPTA